MSTANAQAIAASILAESGHTVTPEGEAAIVSQLAAAIRYDDSKPFLSNPAGHRMVTVSSSSDVVDETFSGFVTGILKSNPAYLETKAETPLASENPTERMRRMKAEGTSARAKAISASVTGNPWLKDQWNLTAQMTISKNDPARAQRLKALAKGGQA